jgi:hypothetical protein
MCSASLFRSQTGTQVQCSLLSRHMHRKEARHVQRHDRADLPVVDHDRAHECGRDCVSNQGGDNACSARSGTDWHSGAVRRRLLHHPSDEVSRLREPGAHGAPGSLRFKRNCSNIIDTQRRPPALALEPRQTMEILMADGGGSGMGVVIGVLLAVVLIGGGLFLYSNSGGGSSKGTPSVTIKTGK